MLRPGILLFLFLTLALTAPVAMAADCLNAKVRVIVESGKHDGNFQPRVIAEEIRTRERDIVEGYHLPLNYTSGYYTRRVEPYLSKPRYSEVKNPSVLYRGMYVTTEELASMLENGMELGKVKWTVAGGNGISFSSDINEAKTYIFHAADQRAGGVGVIIEVRKIDSMVLIDDPVLNSTRTIFKSPNDVSSDDIINIYLWGEYGPESLTTVFDKIRKGTVTPRTKWTNAFDRGFR